ncbi:L-aspartate oxidase [Gracilibacillus sp. YIM 98692]|uniref:L-aspartate oxidase n=1 Tax=Gracilibacillus sp. YIM 98692 TaxID=2663532 RepID=UPI0013D24A2B|nr:L-aspartate oxidase [Gracilibacillus sp. YIM 98692]
MVQPKVLIIGAGLAAFALADRLYQQADVTIITKESIHDTNSKRAQGGIAAAISDDDDWQYHYQDTIHAGNDYNDTYMVEMLTKEGIEGVQELLQSGFPADRDEKGRLCLGMEGAHQNKRIIHAGGDQTGKFLMLHYQQKVLDKINVISHQMVVECLVKEDTCYGVITIDKNDQFHLHIADKVVLATGGCGALYETSSNDPTVTGDGFSIAYRAGAVIRDMEFIQFHPTMLASSMDGNALISEAVRGQGAKLVNQYKRPIMEKVHPFQDLAPRDVVARAITNEEMNGNHVFLDISNITDFNKTFPSITAICENSSIDWRSGYIPVTPGAHFIMGGIQTNENGETNIHQLFAIGEAACTGVHGANRLASNSLLEGLVFADRLAKRILSDPHSARHVPSVAYPKKRDSKKMYLPEKNLLKKYMKRYAGIERNEEGLLKMCNWLESFDLDFQASDLSRNGSREDMEWLHMLTTAWLITTSALKRTESRGAHYRTDFPTSDTKWHRVPIERFKTEVLSNKRLLINH